MILKNWQEAWPKALAVWGRFIKLPEPIFCSNDKEAKAEGLIESFAMIRLVDHRVVVGLHEVEKKGLEGFSLPILAHEVGHHVFAPGDLRDLARMHARIQAALPGKTMYTALVGNLYTDLLINDRLQRQAGLDMAAVFAALEAKRTEPASPLWCLYLRIYELLWKLEKNTLIKEKLSRSQESDARLGARLIRVYERDFIEGAGGFGALVAPYLEKPEVMWLDAVKAGEGSEIPDGLVEVEAGESVCHPADDPRLSDTAGESESKADTRKAGASERSEADTRATRSPDAYQELLKGLGVKCSPEKARVAYYREKARPYLVTFPKRRAPRSVEPLPEGLDLWEPGSNLQSVDWVQSLIQSPVPIPGVSLVERQQGESPGAEPKAEVVDLYLGMDCSGSMPNPARLLSWPVVAGAVMVRSALRAGARAMVCLSGEPGSFQASNGFLNDEYKLLEVLTSYLGTGYSFGAERLRDHILKPVLKRPVYVLVLSDSDWFIMLDRTTDGWKLAEEVAKKAVGVTALLNLSPTSHPDQVEKLKKCGWNVAFVPDNEALIEFARTFSKKHYQKERNARG